MRNLTVVDQGRVPVVAREDAVMATVVIALDLNLEAVSGEV